jgi:hypothetical protein
MRQTISGLVAAMAVVAASAAPAMACGETPCGQQYPVHQYYYVNQGPTYTGPGDFAPYPVYREGGVSGWRGYHHPHYYGYHHHHSYHYGYAPHHGYYAPHMSHHDGYGYRGHTLRRYY